MRTAYFTYVVQGSAPLSISIYLNSPLIYLDTTSLFIHRPCLLLLGGATEGLV